MYDQTIDFRMMNDLLQVETIESILLLTYFDFFIHSPILQIYILIIKTDWIEIIDTIFLHREQILLDWRGMKNLIKPEITRTNIDFRRPCLRNRKRFTVCNCYLLDFSESGFWILRISPVTWLDALLSRYHTVLAGIDDVFDPLYLYLLCYLSCCVGNLCSLWRL